MISVFIGGSRRLGLMKADIARRLDNIMRKHMRVIIGDANGFDRAAQSYLAEPGYQDVVVYCTVGECRNNVGHWPLRAVEYSGRDHGLAFYTAKDDAMLGDADFGLFAWDGKSPGTLRNIHKMAEQAKPSAVYVAPLKKFLTIRHAQDVAVLSGRASPAPTRSDELFSDTRPILTTVSPLPLDHLIT